MTIGSPRRSASRASARPGPAGELLAAEAVAGHGLDVVGRGAGVDHGPLGAEALADQPRHQPAHAGLGAAGHDRLAEVLQARADPAAGPRPRQQHQQRGLGRGGPGGDRDVRGARGGRRPAHEQVARDTAVDLDGQRVDARVGAEALADAARDGVVDLRRRHAGALELGRERAGAGVHAARDQLAGVVVDGAHQRDVGVDGLGRGARHEGRRGELVAALGQPGRLREALGHRCAAAGVGEPAGGLQGARADGRQARATVTSSSSGIPPWSLPANSTPITWPVLETSGAATIAAGRSAPS